MSELYTIQALHLGPIIRQSDKNSITLWGQADNKQKQNCYLIARQTGPTAVNYVAQKATSDTDYIQTLRLYQINNIDGHYQMGVLNIDGDFDATKITEESWTKVLTYKYRLDSSANDNLSFVFGSCRFFLSLKINPFSDKHWVLWGDSGDKIFAKINQQINTDPVDFVAMIGDQIYGDTTISVIDKLTRAKTFDDFQRRYDTAFSYKNIRELMANNTTYMVGDDHEYRDNYNSAVIATEPDVYANSRRAFNLYQYVNGPTNTNNQYWYVTERKGIPFFWMDLRNERTPEKIMSDIQMNAIKTWLLEHKDKVKFLTSSVPMLSHKKDKDNWLEYPDQLQEILDTVVKNNINGLVILTGDSHMGVSAQYEIANGIRVTELMSSGFRAVFHDTSSNVATSQIVGPYNIKSVSTSKAVSEDMYAKVILSINERILRYTMYDKNGKIKTESLYNV